MTRTRLLPLALLAAAAALTAAETAVTIRIDAARRLHRITSRFIGVNMEDLNFQGYGGIYSQLLFGEAFQEHVDSAALGLSDKDRLKVFVGEDAGGRIELWGFHGRGWQHNAAREALGLALKKDDVPVPLDELPAARRDALLREASGDRQVSRHWRPVESGSARGAFRFDRATPFTGRQSQVVRFVSGAGEVGIGNAGLNGWGIHLAKGKPYEGVLRVKAAQTTTLWVSLRDSSGTKKLAEQALDVQGGGEYQRVEFTLVPAAEDEAGRFAVTLRQPGAITVGYAFLQPGDWGRYAGLPLRKNLVEALKAMGVTAIRWDGSMVNKCPDGHLYRWKEMIGPRDLRQPYRGFFNPYASHGFAIFDLLNLCEAAGFLPIPGVRIDETPEDMADFVEYVNGPADSPWGRKRAADGHPAPYRLKHLELGNEERLDENYCRRFETLASAIWAKDPSMTLLVAHNLAGSKPFALGPGGEMGEQLKLALRLVRFAKERRGTIWWDNHYVARPEQYQEPGTPDRIAAMATLRASIAKLEPGYELPFAPLEENGVAHDMQRALTHARNQNAFARMGDYLPVIAVANGLQAYGQDLVWSQGRIHFTPSRVFFQPPFYVDQMVTRAWAPQVVQTSVTQAGNSLDVTARLTESGRGLVVFAVNDGREATVADLAISGFRARSPAKVSELSGSPEAVNSPADPTRVAPRTSRWNCQGNLKYTFPPYSFTVLEFARE